jgi:ribonuclease HI
MRDIYTKILSQLVVPRGRVVIKFNGATKGNPGRAENGGLIHECGGSLFMSYCLGFETEFAALTGLQPSKDMRINRLTVMKDSPLVISIIEGI